MHEVELFVDGRWRTGRSASDVVDPFSGRVVERLSEADDEIIDEAITSAASAQKTPIHPDERSSILRRAAAIVSDREDEFVSTIVAESGFTVADARGEVTRAQQTLRLSGEEATRITGEMIPISSAPDVTNRVGFTLRMPLGVVCAITPFNSPLNTVAHKVGPALAAGNAVVVKPASQTPATANALVDVLLEAGLPPVMIQVLHGPGSSVGTALLSDPRIDFFSFTGSTATGEHIARHAGLRRIQLELGAVSPTLVLADADLDQAAAKIPPSSFRKAGQVCTSIQRLLVEDSVLDDLVERLIVGTNSMVVGDPSDAKTTVGPLITQEDAGRVEEWIEEAVRQGGERLTGGTRSGSLLEPTLVLGPPRQIRLVREEVFGPVLVIDPVRSLDEAIDEVNAGPFGLATGVFTNNLAKALRLAHTLKMGSIHINETSSSRVDLMPYGGVKQSGYGKEGPRYAIRELTEERLITINYGGE